MPLNQELWSLFPVALALICTDTFSSFGFVSFQIQGRYNILRRLYKSPWQLITCFPLLSSSWFFFGYEMVEWKITCWNLVIFYPLQIVIFSFGMFCLPGMLRALFCIEFTFLIFSYGLGKKFLQMLDSHHCPKPHGYPIKLPWIWRIRVERRQNSYFTVSLCCYCCC